jgi:cysteine desulfurase
VEITREKDVEKMKKLRERLFDGLLKIPSVTANGSREKRLCNNVNVSFNNVEGEAVGGYLESFGIQTSTGSACMSHTLETSHVLKALGLKPLQANSSLRVTISKYTTEQEVDFFLDKIKTVVERLRSISPIR